MTPLYKKPFQRNALYALAVLPGTVFLFSGPGVFTTHTALGLVFLLTVVAARLSRPRSPAPQRTRPAR
jgi:hypothetical protein